MPTESPIRDTNEHIAVSRAPMQIPVMRLQVNSTLPAQSHAGDAGYDLYAYTYSVIPSGGRVLIDTGIAMAIPPGFYGRIADRSGRALKQGLHVLGGIIDSGFRGSVGVILLNTGRHSLDIVPGDRIAQLIIERCVDVEFREVDTLEESDRGAAGFGSTG